jgi:hypothetical protein
MRQIISTVFIIATVFITIMMCVAGVAAFGQTWGRPSADWGYGRDDRAMFDQGSRAPRPRQQLSLWFGRGSQAVR